MKTIEQLKKRKEQIDKQIKQLENLPQNELKELKKLYDEFTKLTDYNEINISTKVNVEYQFFVNSNGKVTIHHQYWNIVGDLDKELTKVLKNDMKELQQKLNVIKKKEASIAKKTGLTIDEVGDMVYRLND